ncbi:hypothetical protein [Bacillus gaemokensis]|uniref:Uncharacterized protein n=1 Tax=Bacillus gaemokensis TaxID=574375 RepID=A0A073K9B1_9BACI|nr:hypothetical protein [Bacillus gaemokensis]KEK23874.1 hypothetical protein BAGA_05380 [Bacillus gaemokensis]KYG38116.1 hypothetical protein AZF08_20415 [Bacillus gaemokensis]
MRKFTINQVSNMRGFDALTQGEASIEEMLLHNCNELKNTRRGFNVTRIDVLASTEDSLITKWVEMCLKLTPEELKDDYVKKALRFMAEKILRDHCTEQMADTFRENIVNRYNILGQDIQKVVHSISKYLKCGRVVPVAQSYREALEELSEGVVIYDEPKNH